MNPRIYFILTFTFITGIFAGAYLYVTSFAPEYQQSDVEVLSEIEFRLQGQATGGCQMAGAGVCPSFVLNQNRSFEYVPFYRLQEEEPTTLSGKLDTKTFESVIDAVEAADVEKLQKENTFNCVSYSDGVDYSYRLTREGEVSELSTCGMNFVNSPLAAAFELLWDKLESASEANEDVFEDGIGGYLRDTLDKKFEYDDN